MTHGPDVSGPALDPDPVLDSDSALDSDTETALDLDTVPDLAADRRLPGSLQADRHALARTESAPDLGLFGPDSVTWRIHTDPVMWVAAFYALAIQSLHPRTMWGTYQHSSLFDRRHALARFLRTADFVTVRTFGSHAEVAKVGRRVRGIHARLRGHDPETGEEFRIDEPENLLWVHCGEILAYLRIAQRARVPLTAGDADAYVAEQRRAAAVVGIDPAVAPGSVAELDAYFARMLPRLRLTDEALAGIRVWTNIETPSRLLGLKVAYPTLAAMAFTLIPGWARKIYGLPAGGRVTEAAATAALRATRLAMLATPLRYRNTATQTHHISRALALMNGRPAPSPAPDPCAGRTNGTFVQ